MAVTSKFYQRVFALAVAAILGYALMRIFLPFADALAWAAFMAFLLFPINIRLRRRFGGRRALAAALLTVLAPIVLLPLAALSFAFVTQISALLRRLQTATAGIDIKTFADLQQFPVVARIGDQETQTTCAAPQYVHICVTRLRLLASM
jgi:predicted PurR-regulated permease PerM